MRQSKKIYGLIGRNVDYSWSPLIHNTAFEALGLPCFYTIFNIADPESIREALLGAKALGIGGFNVTIPYKKTVVPFMDNLSAEAATIGAVNTIVIRDGTLSGHNTDIEGFAAPLRPFADRISGKNVCIFGNGGAALAAIEAFRLFFNTEKIILFVRNPEKAATMLEGYPHKALVTISLQNEKIEQVRECAVVVNATPIGTSGRLNDPVSSIVPLERGLIHRGQIVYDMVYNPLETPLLNHAAAVGATTIGGLEMLLGQAARSFFIWTAQELPEETVKRHLMQEIAKGS